MLREFTDRIPPKIQEQLDWLVLETNSLRTHCSDPEIKKWLGDLIEEHVERMEAFGFS